MNALHALDRIQVLIIEFRQFRHQRIGPARRIQFFFDRRLIGELVKKGRHHPPLLHLGQAGMRRQIAAKPLTPRRGHDLFDQAEFPFKCDRRINARHFPHNLAPDQWRIFVAPHRHWNIRMMPQHPRDQLGPAQMRSIMAPQQRLDRVKVGLFQKRRQERRRIDHPDKQFQMIIRKQLPKQVQPMFGRAVQYAPIHRHLGRAEKPRIGQDQPIHSPLVADRIHQNITRIRGKPRVLRVVQYIAYQTAIALRIGNIGSVTRQHFAIGGQAVDQPVLVSVMGACVNDNLHPFSGLLDHCPSLYGLCARVKQQLPCHLDN
ncbi:hypothetical protein RV134_350427 [Roseovarius sp. EC-HK134]|nr:hypothetical protein RV134_350427 [Roseovarius sp. EC-HK134]